MGFTIGALSVEVINQREKTALAIQAECAYHTGYDEGYRDHIEEDDPRWDCHTMGNKICGKGRK